MTPRHLNILAIAGLLAAHLATTANGQTIYFKVADLGGGKTQWRLVSADTNYTVGTFDATGNFGEQIILPKGAFTFNYSSNFTFAFSSPIGVIKNLTSGESVSLNQISYYLNLDSLQLVGGVMSHSLGDKFAITNFSISDIAIPFSRLTGTNLNSGYTYSAPGAWHNTSGISIKRCRFGDLCQTNYLFQFQQFHHGNFGVGVDLLVE